MCIRPLTINPKIVGIKICVGVKYGVVIQILIFYLLCQCIRITGFLIEILSKPVPQKY